MNIFKRIFGNEQRAEEENLTPQMDTQLLRLFMQGESISKSVALGIPAIAGSVNLISSIAANVRYKLYCYDEKKRLTEMDDKRVNMFNCNTGDLLNGYEMKRAFIRDYLIMGNGYIYKNMGRNNIESLHYVDEINISVVNNEDPIFKKAKILVNGTEYYPHDFVIIARNSTDGIKGQGLLSENAIIIKLLNNMLKMLNSNAETGGLKKGFLESERVIEGEKLAELRENFNAMYRNEGIPLLNKGVKFNPITESRTEMQIKELYEGISDDAGEILQLPKSIKEGAAKDEEFRNWFKICIIPILNEIVAALNESMLLESEKGICFWKADTSELENGDLKSMFTAYNLALSSNVMQLDEVRERIGLPPLGFNFLKLGLDTVLLDTEKNIIYTPNTNMVQNLKDIDRKMGEGNRDPSADEERNK